MTHIMTDQELVESIREWFAKMRAHVAEMRRQLEAVETLAIQWDNLEPNSGYEKILEVLK